MIEPAPLTPEALLQQHLPRLRAFIRLRCDATVRARESCSDLVQSVCREVLTQAHRREFATESAFCGWLYTKALDKVRDRYRYHHAQRRAPEREATAEDDLDYGAAYASVLTPSRFAIGREDLRTFEHAFEHLTERQREAITLSKLVGLSHAEIAAHLGINVQQVADALRHGLRKLSLRLAARR